MLRDHRSHSDPKLPPSMEPVQSSGFSFNNDLMKIRDCNTNKPLKVKRRKTKKELNNAKFKSHTETFQKKTFPRGVLQRNNMVGKMVSQSGMKAANNSRQVFITENRLTHHQGIFNHEIKSIDIGRLVNQATKVDLSTTGTAHSRGRTPQRQGQVCLGLIPTPELKNQDISSSQKEHSPEIPGHISDGPWCNQKDNDPTLCNQRDHKCVSCNQQDHERASCNQQDRESVSCNQQDHKRALCNQQDHECASCNQQDDVHASSSQKDNENASCNQQDYECASCNQKHECASYNQQDNECASCNQQDHEHVSCNQEDHDYASCNHQDDKHVSCKQLDCICASCNQQDHECALCDQRDHTGALHNQENHEHASYNQQDQKRSAGNHKDHKRSAGNHTDHKRSAGNRKDHKHTLCNQQGHNQHNIESTCYNQQDQDPTFCNQPEKEIEKCQSCPQDENQANPGSETTMSPFRNEATPVLKTAEDIVNMLNARSLFPGRNLISETRQAILKKVKNLRDTKPLPPPVPVERNPGHNQPGNAHMYKDLGCSVKTGTSNRKLVQTTQRGRPPIQTPPTWYRPIPSDSPAHTLIKRASPEDHLDLKDVLHQPIHYGSDCNLSRQYRQIPSQCLPNSLNSSSRDPKPGREERKLSSLRRVRKAGNMPSSPLNTYSPQVRWRLANDLPTDSPFTRNVPSSDIRHIGTTRATNQECVSRASVEDISEAQSTSRGRIKECFPDGEKTSEVFWGGRHQRSSETISPAAIRLLANEQITHDTYLASNFGSHHSAFLQKSITNPDGSLCVFPLDSLGGLGREANRHMSSWQEGGLGPHCVTHAAPKLRRLPASKCPNTWKPSSHLQEKPKDRAHRDVGNDGGKKRVHSNDWRHGSLQEELYSQPRNMSAALSPQFAQQASPFLPFQRKKSSDKSLLSRLSPDTWVYPRMKLY